MPVFSDLFINLQTQPGLGGRDGGNFTQALREAVDLILRSETRRGVVWFPPGNYRVNTGLTIDARVTLSFAPGAMLIPIIRPGGVTDPILRLSCSIDAGLHMIFGTTATVASSFLPDAVGLGRVAILGDIIQRVFPEWWGASRSGPFAEPLVDTEAIRAAFQAAVIDREVLSDEAPLPPVVVEFRGSYELTGEVLVERSSATLRAVSLLGTTGPGGPTTLRTRERGAARALLTFARVQQLQVRGLAFDALDGAQHCVRVETSLGRDPVVHRVEVDGCSFVNGSEGALVVVDDTTVEPARGSVLAAVRRCRFGGIEKRFIRKVAPQTDLLHPLGTDHAAVHARAAFATVLLVSECAFGGFARRAIRAEGARVELYASRFDIIESPDTLFMLATDVELSAAPVVEPRFASLTATSCTSRSPSFLRVLPGMLPKNAIDTKGFSSSPVVVLTNVAHRRGRATLGSYHPPAVIWEEPNARASAPARPAPADARLTLIGCSFDPGPTLLPYPSDVRIALEPAMFTSLGVTFGLSAGPSPVPRVYVGTRLDAAYNVGTFRVLEDRTHAFLTFGGLETLRPSVRSLGQTESVDGPLPVSFYPLFSRMGGIGSWILPFAWANWLWEE